MNNNINQINESTQVLMGMADDMAAAATMFNAHGYDMFIKSREALKEALKIHLNDKSC